MTSAPRLAILVLSSAAQPWARIEEEGQVPTWIDAARSGGVPVIRYRGTVGRRDRRLADTTKQLTRRLGPGRAAKLADAVTRVAHPFRRTALENDVLRVRTPEVKVMLSTKLHLALRWLIRSVEFDLVFRTNSSTYINLPALRRTAAGVGRTGVYAGVRGVESLGSEQLPYAAGMGVLMSRDVIRSVVRSRGLVSALVDDIALGLCCRDLGYDVTEIDRGDAATVEEARSIPLERLRDLAFIRCKSRLPRDERADLEVAIMRTLHDRLGPSVAQNAR